MNDQKECIFCKIIKKEIPAKIVAENDLAIAFLDVDPVSDGHTLVIPKSHCLDFGTCYKNDLKAVCDLAQDVSRMIEESKLEPWGFNFLSNQGKIARQEVMHFHMHVIPKYEKDKGFLFSKSSDGVQSTEVIYEQLLKYIKKYNK